MGSDESKEECKWKDWCKWKKWRDNCVFDTRGPHSFMTRQVEGVPTE